LVSHFKVTAVAEVGSEYGAEGNNDDVARSWRKLQNEELHYLDSSPKHSRMIKKDGNGYEYGIYGRI
jgi:hypothetical protein